MKKRKNHKKVSYFHIALIIIVTIIILLPESMVFSQDVNNNISEDEIKENIEVNVKGELGNFTGGIKGVGDGVDNVLEKELVFPTGVDNIARLVLGLRGIITLQIFLVYLFIWLLVFLMISQAVNLLPMFNSGGILNYVVGFIVTCLASLTGAMKLGSDMVLGLSEIFNFIDGFSGLTLVISIVIILVLFMALSFILNYFKKRKIMDGAEVASNQAAAGIKIAKDIYKASAED